MPAPFVPRGVELEGRIATAVGGSVVRTPLSGISLQFDKR